MKKKNALPAVTDFADTYNGEHDKAVYFAAIETETFTDPVQPLQAFANLRTELIRVSNHPAKVIPIFVEQTAGMTDAQKLFIAQKVRDYFSKTLFFEDGADRDDEGFTLMGIVEPLRHFITRLERAALPQVADIRATLKEVFRKEMERLPEALNGLDDNARLNFLCKLMPFVLPKMETVAATKGEPGDWVFE